MSDDKIKESDDNEVNVDDYQAKEETTLTRSDIPRQDREKIGKLMMIKIKKIEKRVKRKETIDIKYV